MSLGSAAELKEMDGPSAAVFPRGTEFLASLASSFLDHAAFALVYVDADLRCRHAAPRFAALLDTQPDALLGRRLSEIDHAVARGVAEALAHAAGTGTAAPVDCFAARGDGRRVMLTGCVIPHRLADGTAEGGETPGFLGIFQDIADEERIADFVMRRDPFVATLLDAAVDGIVITDRKGVIRSINRACCQQFGYEEADLLGQNVTALMPPPFSRDHDRFIQTYLQTDRAKIIGIGRESLGRRKDGTVFPIHLSVGQARMGEEITFVAMIRDISDRLAAEQRASYLARHDALTGVLTRTAFLEECEAVLARGSVDGGGDATPCFALYSLDVDQFSDINEAFGFHVGDAALKALVSRVIEVLPKETYICRIAADEFAALSRVDDLDQARTLADVLHDRLTASIYADRHWVRLRVSIGAAVFDPSVQRMEELNAKAKLALQSVQHNGGNAVCFYTPEMAAAATRRMLLTMHLAHAIERNELHLVYQPIVEAKTGEVTSAEALLRWTHHTLGAISPGEFIPVAEESGLIVPITDWVLATVVRQMAEWDSRGVLPKRVFLNISGQQFLRGNLTHRLVELLEDQPHLRGHLGLEITEQAAVRDLKVAVRTLSDLADIGVQVAIDDFGSGYSSLSYVQQLPVAKLKIDRAFIIDVPENSRNAALVRAAVGMAHGLGLVTVAEGVETVEQREFLASTGCDQLQGYLFGRPMLPDALAEMVREQRAAKTAR